MHHGPLIAILVAGLGLAGVAHAVAGSLAYAHQSLLGMAIALARRPRLVLLDEPFQGLAPVLAQQYGASLQRLLQQRPQLTVVVTESNRSLLKDLPTNTLVLERGSLQPGAASAAF
mgnify:CR=1 FL=1